jgi:hypothetical protein
MEIKMMTSQKPVEALVLGLSDTPEHLFVVKMVFCCRETSNMWIGRLSQLTGS